MRVIAYARVSSSDQRADLVRQSEALSRHLAERSDSTSVEQIADIGSLVVSLPTEGQTAYAAQV